MFVWSNFSLCLTKVNIISYAIPFVQQHVCPNSFRVYYEHWCIGVYWDIPLTWVVVSFGASVFYWDIRIWDYISDSITIMAFRVVCMYYTWGLVVTISLMLLLPPLHCTKGLSVSNSNPSKDTTYVQWLLSELTQELKAVLVSCWMRYPAVWSDIRDPHEQLLVRHAHACLTHVHVVTPKMRTLFGT